jgi:hypothetical protein
MYSTGILWRNTARPVSFFFLDARAMICFAIWVLYMCKETFYLSLTSLAIFFVFERFGVTPAAAFRFIRVWLFDKKRVHHSLYLLRRNCR